MQKLSRRYFYSTEDFKKAKVLLERYLRGENVSFKMRLCLESFSPFTQRVFQKVRTIPYGETRSYKWVGKGRAVGQALKRNPLTIIVPCHRVIKSNGEIGGFSKGIVVKKRLLEMEKLCSAKF